MTVLRDSEGGGVGVSANISDIIPLSGQEIAEENRSIVVERGVAFDKGRPSIFV